MSGMKKRERDVLAATERDSAAAKRTKQELVNLLDPDYTPPQDSRGLFQQQPNSWRADPYAVTGIKRPDSFVRYAEENPHEDHVHTRVIPDSIVLHTQEGGNNPPPVSLDHPDPVRLKEVMNKLRETMARTSKTLDEHIWAAKDDVPGWLDLEAVVEQQTEIIESQSTEIDALQSEVEALRVWKRAATEKLRQHSNVEVKRRKRS